MSNKQILAEDLKFFVEHFPFLEEVKGKTFMVSGATGLIGSIFIKCLLQLNETLHTDIKIIAIARNKAKAESIFGATDIQWIFRDLLELTSIADYKVNYIVHCASATSSRFFIEQPVETLLTAFQGTDLLLRYARDNKVDSMVYLSSLESYGTVLEEREISEDDCGYIKSTDVRSCYSLGKRSVECLCHSYSKEYGVPVKIARLTQVFGAGVSPDDNRVFAQFAKSILRKESITLHTTGESSKPYCYTIDTVLALLYLLIKGESGEAYNVANADSYISIRGMAEMLAATFSHDTKVIIDLRDDMGYAPSTKLKLNTSKLEALGWQAHFSLEEMFERLLAYFS